MTALTPVKSSNLSAVSYDPTTRVLTVAFKSGQTHDYHDVAPHHFDAMKAAPSVGKYFHAHIRSAHKSKKREDA